MKNNTIIIVLVVLLASLGVYTYISHTRNNDFKKSIEEKEKEIITLRRDFYILQDDYDILEAKKPKIIYRQSKTKQKLKDQVDETNAIPGIVSSYSDRMLDSIITNHKHTKRSEN